MESDEEETDLAAIQAHLELSMAMTYQAVEASLRGSNLPDEQNYSNLASLVPRPPRLGLGAVPVQKNGEHNPLARETSRLTGRLAGKKRTREDDDDTRPLNNSVKKLKVSPVKSEDEDDSEAEESRTKSVANKKIQSNGVVDRFALPGKKQKAKAAKADAAVNGKPLLLDARQLLEAHQLSNDKNKSKLDEKLFAVPPVPAARSSPAGAEPTTTPTLTELNGKHSSSPTRLSSPKQISSPTPSSPIQPSRPSPHRSSSILSRSSTTTSSRYSKDLERRTNRKKQAINGFRIVKVERIIEEDGIEPPLLIPLFRPFSTRR